jgi:nucleotide-binding universal stress UspA family protein
MSFNNILFPIDFSGHSLALNKQVEWIASRFHSSVTLIHVFELPYSWCAGGEASLVNMECFATYRKEMGDRLQSYQLNIPNDRLTRVLAEGDAAWQIATWAAEHDVDLIMMGSHGYGKLAGMLLGSVTSKILHSSRCPVWVDCIRPNRPDIPMGNRFKILCALEKTEESPEILQYVKHLAEEWDATVHLLHCVSKAELNTFKYTDFDLYRYMADAARVEIARLQRQAGTDYPLTISGEGIPDAAAQIARREKIDLIITGRGKVQETFGRVRTQIFQMVHEAPCPVLSYSCGNTEASTNRVPMQIAEAVSRKVCAPTIRKVSSEA